MRQARGRTVILAAALLLVLAVLLGVGIGAVRIPPREVLRILFSRLPWSPIRPDWPDTHETILFAIRIPRVVMGALAGMALGLAGGGYQGIFKNPLADPYIIGVSAGAALGAASAFTLFQFIQVEAVGTVPFFAFTGGLAAVFVVYRLAVVGRHVPVLALLMAGVAVGSLCMAMVSLLMYFARPNERDAILFWTMGGLGGATWEKVAYITPYLVVGVGLLLWYGRELNALLLGDDSARHLGVDVEAIKRIVLTAGVLLTASTVAFVGAIGFIGMIVPHIARMLVGPDHRFLLPAAGIGGAVVLVLADMVARSLLGGAEIPVGLVMAFAGGPFFLWLLRQKLRTARI